MAFTFKDTKLLRHPEVEAAFNYIARQPVVTGQNKEAKLKNAARPAELVMALAKKPDPSALAALMALHGNVTIFNSRDLISDVSKNCYELFRFYHHFDADDPSNPMLQNQGCQQVFLGTMLVSLMKAQTDMAAKTDGGPIHYSQLRDLLKGYKRTVDLILPYCSDISLLARVIETIDHVETGLDQLVIDKKNQYLFKNTGLPDHPLVRQAYEFTKSLDVTEDNPLGHLLQPIVDTALILHVDGACHDPDMIAAALLNQFTDTTSAPGIYVRQNFPARVADLYEETSPMARAMRDIKKLPHSPQTDDGRLLRAVFAVKTAEALKDKGRIGSLSHDPSKEALGRKYLSELALADSLDVAPALRVRINKIKAVIKSDLPPLAPPPAPPPLSP